MNDPRDTRAPDEAQHAAELLELGDAFFELDHGWRILRVNARQELLTGRPREQTVGRTFAEVWPDLATPASRYWQEVRRCMEERVPVEFEELYPPVGMWTGVTAYPTSAGGVAVFFRDISRQKLMELQARQREVEANRRAAEVEAVLGSVADGVLVYDREGRIVRANGAAEAILGYDAADRALPVAERLARHGHAWLTEGGVPIAPEELPPMRAAHHGETVRGVILRLRSPDGEQWLRVSAAPLRVGDVLSGAVVSLSDVTAVKRTEQALREADRRKNDFLAVLSHELRNPLAPIRNSLYILDHADPAGPQARRACEVATRQVAHLTRLVDDLLDVTRIARGKIELRRAPLDVAALARRTAEDRSALMRERGLALAVELPPGPVTVRGDETRLAQVLGNLLHNAAKFTPAGGRITLTLRTEEASALLHVRDTGAGVDPETMRKIFEPFTQARDTRARSEGGLGLGLALVKGLVELHGGRVAVSSEGPGRGTDVAVTLPLDTPVPAATGEREPGATSPRPRSRRVLVIDDNRDAADSLAQLVTLMGHSVDVAYDAMDGLARTAGDPPDVVLCDIGLPGMDGYEFARQLRTRAPRADVRLVAVSGYAQPEDVSRAVEAGFDAHVPKPPDPERLAGLLA